jgi:hypothetical protein
MFKPSCLLGLQVAPTTVIISQGSQTFYTTHSPVGYLPWEWYRYMPESGNWHGGTFTRWITALSAAPRPETQGGGGRFIQLRACRTVYDSSPPFFTMIGPLVFFADTKGPIAKTITRQQTKLFKTMFLTF